MSDQLGDLVSVEEPLVMLEDMAPSNVFGITDLAQRWAISKTSADAVTRRPDFTPNVKRMNATGTSDGLKYVDREELIAWEQSLLAEGKPIPGTKATRGPDRQPRKRRGAAVIRRGLSNG